VWYCVDVDKRDVTPKDCLCGCGTQTKGGEFAAGHDARYKAALINVALDTTSTDEQRQFAVGVLERRKWGHFLEKARERRAAGYVPRKATPFTKKGKEAAKAAEAALTDDERRAIAQAREAAAERSRIAAAERRQRAEEEGQAALDRLYGMKRALKVVRAHGLRSEDGTRELQVTPLNWETIIASYPEPENQETAR
jgi:hypothetical protein